jgi:ankyrin repeat protein
MANVDVLSDFITAATVPDTHRAGNLDRARALLAEHPDLPRMHVGAACVLGDADALRAFLDSDPECATRRSGVRKWDPLLYLTFSLFLRDDPDRRPAFRECARMLLEAGADPNTFWVDPPEAFRGNETAVYGACGVAHDAPLTKMLLEAGADPNDGESPYHAVEVDDMACALLLFEHGLNADGRATALLHRLDWDDLAGMERLIEAGADPNHLSPFRKGALHQALLRSRTLPFFERLLEMGANPDVRMTGGLSAYALAARLGRADVVRLFQRHGADTELDPVSAFIAACAAGDGAGARAQLDASPDLMARLTGDDRKVIVHAAADGNTTGVRAMLDAGFDIETVGDWGGTTIHHAGWHGRADTVALLVERGAKMEVVNHYGGTVLDTTVWAIEHSGLAGRDHLGAVRQLLQGGADPKAVSPFPTGVAEVDALLRAHGR